MAAHVSVSPNEQTHRATNLRTRGIIALSGMFGYELELNDLSADERAAVIDQVALHRAIENVVRTGDLYRLLSPFAGRLGIAAWMYVDSARDHAILFVANCKYYELVWGFPRVRLRGLDPTANYRIDYGRGIVPMEMPGAALMGAAGITVDFRGDGQAYLIRIDRV